jgi:tetratricopeptide (TPR) repeat protein
MNNSAEDIIRRATAAFNAGRREDAQKLCEQGLKREPGEPMLSHLFAAVLFADGAIAPARAQIEISLKSRPDHAAARLLAARIARADKDFDAALAHLDAAIALAPQRETFVEKARTLDQGGLKGRAREAWQAIQKVIPDHPEAAARLGRLAFEDGDLATAASQLAQATEKDAPASVWFDLGLVSQDQRNYPAAADAYRKAIALKPDFAEAALNLGIVLQETGDLDAAMATYREAYRLRSDMLGSIAMALTSSPHGRLWLDEDALKKSLVG